MTKLLIVDDQQDFTDSLQRGLQEEGFEVDVAYNGIDGKKMIHPDRYEVIILDVTMPGEDGVTLCKKIRSEGIHTPVLFISALDSVPDKLTGFESGGDDYLAKPFHFDELVARIRALMRRFGNTSPANVSDKSGSLVIDRVQMTAFREGRNLGLTKKEFRLLEYFYRNEGKVLSKSELAENVWDVDFDTGTNVVEVYVNYLRNKLDKGFDKKLITTKFGLGYVFNDE